LAGASAGAVSCGTGAVMGCWIVMARKLANLPGRSYRFAGDVPVFHDGNVAPDMVPEMIAALSSRHSGACAARTRNPSCGGSCGPIDSGLVALARAAPE
ncbi:MAG: hypothetical protein E6848_25030, partial [Bradyrhizobium sp.]|nr:hypothetical protein [Bradyrhizobium sp.]